jgi:hypothetical protein
MRNLSESLILRLHTVLNASNFDKLTTPSRI